MVSVVRPWARDAADVLRPSRRNHHIGIVPTKGDHSSSLVHQLAEGVCGPDRDRAGKASPKGEADLPEHGLRPLTERSEGSGPDRDRTGDLMNAIHARSQLRYWPTLRGRSAGVESLW